MAATRPFVYLMQRIMGEQLAKKIYKDFTMRTIKKHFSGLERLIYQPDWKIDNLKLLNAWCTELQHRVNVALKEELKKEDKVCQPAQK